eukprot:GHVT01028500.1.p1 GENE.GHVT01028500.1~~GHVT01028500.1.p1  ORF type:complete len:329 (+),score=37.46 GHVT01028500.1:978-1964(+)
MMQPSPPAGLSPVERLARAERKPASPRPPAIAAPAPRTQRLKFPARKRIDTMDLINMNIKGHKHHTTKKQSIKKPPRDLIHKICNIFKPNQAPSPAPLPPQRSPLTQIPRPQNPPRAKSPDHGRAMIEHGPPPQKEGPPAILPQAENAVSPAMQSPRPHGYVRPPLPPQRKPMPEEPALQSPPSQREALLQGQLQLSPRPQGQPQQSPRPQGQPQQSPGSPSVGAVSRRSPTPMPGIPPARNPTPHGVVPVAAASPGPHVRQMPHPLSPKHAAGSPVIQQRPKDLEAHVPAEARSPLQRPNYSRRPTIDKTAMYVFSPRAARISTVGF